MKKCVIITTINEPGKVIKYFEKLPNWDLIVVGDLKTPDESYEKINCVYLSMEKQFDLYPVFANLLPSNHYARKNIGYIYAIKNNYDVIYETDDDTIPMTNLNEFFNSNKCIVEPFFPNIAMAYTNQKIWARGYPLDLVNNNQPIVAIDVEETPDIHIIQGLVNGNPDVDAIYRLTYNSFEEDFYFNQGPEYIIEKGVWVPFNTQNTYWLNSFRYLYLPSTVSFRFCDILKGYIAQKGIWEVDGRLGYRTGDVIQDRNEHDLMKDFISEIPVYTQIYDVIYILNNSSGNLLEIYSNLVDNGIVDKKELDILVEWEKLLNEI